MFQLEKDFDNFHPAVSENFLKKWPEHHKYILAVAQSDASKSVKELLSDQAKIESKGNINLENIILVV